MLWRVLLKILLQDEMYIYVYIYEFEFMSILYEIILYYFEIFVQNVNCRCTVLFMEYIIK